MGGKLSIYNQKIMENKTSIELDIAIYPKEAIIGASYVFIDRVFVYLDSKKKGAITVTLKNKNDEEDTKVTEGEFMNELLNYVHRLNISKYNKKIRESIVERALYSSVGNSLIDDEDDDFDDPLGIAVPWEEKYGGDEANK